MAVSGKLILTIIQISNRNMKAKAKDLIKCRLRAVNNHNVFIRSYRENKLTTVNILKALPFHGVGWAPTHRRRDLSRPKK